MKSNDYDFSQLLNIEKIINSILWFCQKNDNNLNILKSLKLIFFADRYHIRKFGRFITFDKYYAFKFGPGGSTTYDILKSKFRSPGKKVAPMKDFFKIKDNNIEALKQSQLDIFSKSEIESLKFSENHFNKFDNWSLSYISHDYPEWKKYKDLFDTNKTKRQIIDLLDFFKNPDLNNSPSLKIYLDGKDVFSDIDPDLLESNKKSFIEFCHIQNSWNS